MSHAQRIERIGGHIPLFLALPFERVIFDDNSEHNPVAKGVHRGVSLYGPPGDDDDGNGEPPKPRLYASKNIHDADGSYVPFPDRWIDEVTRPLDLSMSAERSELPAGSPRADMPGSGANQEQDVQGFYTTPITALSLAYAFWKP